MEPDALLPYRPRTDIGVSGAQHIIQSAPGQIEPVLLAPTLLLQSALLGVEPLYAQQPSIQGRLSMPPLVVGRLVTTPQSQGRAPFLLHLFQ